jgi:biofilm protein TabA
MILDTLQNKKQHAALNKNLQKGLEFLNRTDLGDLPEGTYEIEGDQIFAIVAHASGRQAGEGQLEGHRKYIDIQYIISGNEAMGWKPSPGLTPATDYDSEKDLIFFEERPDSTILVPPGSYAIFFPEDAHLPLIGNGPIHKIIIKVAV